VEQIAREVLLHALRVAAGKEERVVRGGVRDGLEVLGPLLGHAVEQVHGSDH